MERASHDMALAGAGTAFVRCGKREKEWAAVGLRIYWAAVFSSASCRDKQLSK
jgi:hypothetical protein